MVLEEGEGTKKAARRPEQATDSPLKWQLQKRSRI